MASKWYTNLSISMIIVLAVFTSCGKSQSPESSPEIPGSSPIRGPGPSPLTSRGKFQSPESSPVSSPGLSPGPVNEFCRTADFKDLCTKMVRGATNLHDATRNAVESGLNIATKLQQMIPMLEPAVSHLPPKTRESILDTCREDFERNVDDFKRGLEYVDQDDLYSLNVHLSAATTSDCFDSFEGCVMPQPVADRITMMKQASSNCLAVSEQK